MANEGDKTGEFIQAGSFVREKTRKLIGNEGDFSSVISEIEKVGGKIVRVPWGSNELFDKKSYHPASLHYMDQNKFTIYVIDEEPLEIENWLIAREFAHYCLHTKSGMKPKWFYVGGDQSITEESGKASIDREDDETSSFVVGFLMPEDEIKRFLNKKDNKNKDKDLLIYDLSEYFGVWEGIMRIKYNAYLKRQYA